MKELRLWAPAPVSFVPFSASSHVCASVSSSVKWRQHHDLRGSGTGKLKRHCAHTASRTSLAQNTIPRAPALLGFFLPPLHVLTEMTSGIQSTDHWEKEENMPNSRDCSRICWWQGLPVAAWAPPPPPSLNKEAKSLGFCRRPLGQGKPGHLFSLFQPVPVFILPCLV